MSSGITNELDDLAKSFKLYRLKTELDFHKSRDDDLNSDKINTLIKIITNVEGVVEKDTSKSKIQNAFDEIDKMVYKKQWKKFPNFHKNIKIKEYLLEFYETKDERDCIENILLNAVENKELNRDEYVIYDQDICKITAIPILKQNSEGLYFLEYPTKKVVARVKKIQSK